MSNTNSEPAPSEVHYLEFQEGTTNKFWTIELLGSAHTVHYGKKGRNGRKQVKTFDSEESARSALGKRVQQKLNSGYVEVHPNRKISSGGSRDNWEGLYQSLCRDAGFEIRRPEASEIDDVLDGWESELEIELPNSYRKFIHRFGPGEIGWGVVIYGPKIPRWRTSGEIPKETKVWRGPGALADMTDDPALLDRLVCLAGSIGGDAFFWDLADVANQRTKSRPIYVLDRSSMHVGDELPLIAGSFDEFIEHVCLGDRFIGKNSGYLNDVPPQQYASSWKHKAIK